MQFSFRRQDFDPYCRKGDRSYIVLENSDYVTVTNVSTDVSVETFSETIQPSLGGTRTLWFFLVYSVIQAIAEICDVSSSIIERLWYERSGPASLVRVDALLSLR